MKEDELKILDQINEFADQVLKGMDLEKTPISVQLEKLTPVMEQIAREKNLSLEEVFIMYMDLNLNAQIAQNKKLKEKLGDI